MKQRFEVVKYPVDVREYRYRSESLLNGVLEALQARGLITDGEELLLTGVKGTKSILKERTHRGRFVTFGVEVSELIGKDPDTFNDPFNYADEVADRAPTVMVYDRTRMVDGDDVLLRERYRAEMGRELDHIMFGVVEGSLDEVTRAAVYLPPVGLHR